MTDQKDWLQVLAPDQWMSGWDNFHKKLLEAPDEYYKELSFIAHPVQVVGAFVHGKGKGLNVLEFGTGDGRYACFLAKMGCKVYTMDALESSIEVTKKRISNLDLDDSVKVEQKDIADFTIPKKEYDIIVAVQVLQYLFDQATDKLREIADAVKPGGVVCYCGNIPPHMETDPPMRFITRDELDDIFNGWTYLSVGQDERLLRPGDLRGYLWLVVQKPEENSTES